MKWVYLAIGLFLFMIGWGMVESYRDRVDIHIIHGGVEP